MQDVAFWIYIGISFLAGFITCILGYGALRGYYRHRRTKAFYQEVIPILNNLKSQLSDNDNVDFIRDTVTKVVRLTAFRHFGSERLPEPKDPIVKYTSNVRYECTLCRDQVAPTERGCCPYCGLFSGTWVPEHADE